MPLTPVLTTRWGAEQSWRLATYERLEGYAALRTALAMAPDELVTLVKDSGLRGRGGAGFPTGMKWSFIPQPKPGETPTGPAAMPKYLVVNADEGEPGTCKDLPLMMADPHSLIEGVIIAAYAIRSHFAVIYVRGEAVHAHRRLMAAVEEAYAAGYLGTDILGSGYDLELVVHAGAGAYICGEETALLDSLEGYRGQPRLKPPFPAVAGLYGAPTVINNVETLASVPFVVRGGADWFKEFGPEKSPGPKIYSLSGRVVRPGQYEAPMGTTMRELLEMAGGVRPGHELKFWTPGGSSTPYFTAEHLDVPLDFDSVAAAGSMLGTTALMVFDETDSIVEATLRFTEFYAHESCGKCTPCREGTYWLVQILERLVHGRGTAQDLDLLIDTCDNILGRSFCALGDGATSCIASSLKYFKDDYVALLPPEEQARLGRVAPHRARRSCLVTITPAAPAPAPAVPPGAPGPHTPPDAVHCTIDGFEVAVPKGTLIIRAAEQIGVQIPRFCDHPLLEPVGACRQCLVEVEGQRKPVASCTMPVTEGMVVHTQLTSDVADKAQQGTMELLLINHPLDCPVCDKGGECPLQNQAMSNGRTESRFVDVKRTYPKPLPICQRDPARPRALRALRPLHPVLPAGRRRPVHRAVRARRAGAGRHLRGRAVRVLLLRQHHPDLPGRRADQRAVPVPRPPVRPAQRAQRLRALRVGLRPAHRLPARQGHPPAGRRGPRGQRGVELRQGPLRLPLRHGQRAADHAAGARRRRRAAPRLLARGLGRRGRRACSPRVTTAASASCPAAG